MRVYSASKNASGAQTFTLQSGTAPSSLRLVEFRRGMHSTNATVTRDRGTFQRTTGGVTPTNATEDKRNSQSPSPNGNVVTAWGTVPTLTGSVVLLLYNGYRQTDGWNSSWHPPRPWAAPILGDAEQNDAREVDTGGSPAHTVVFSESLAEAYAGTRLHHRPTRGALYCYRNTHTKAALTTAVNKQNRLDERWSTFVRLPRPVRGVANWISFYSPTGTTFFQTLDATVSAGASLQKEALKVLSSSVIAIATVQKQINKIVSAIVTSVATLTKQVDKTLSDDVTNQASLSRQTNKTLDDAVSNVGVLTRETLKVLNASVSTLAALQKQVNKILSTSVTTTATVQAVKVLIKTLDAAVSTSASLQRQVNKFLDAIVTIDETLQRQVSKILTSAVTNAATLQALKVIVKVMDAVVTTSAALQKQVNKEVSSVVVIVSTLTKQVNKSLSSAVSNSASLQALRVFVRDLSTSVVASASLQRQVDKVLTTVAPISAQVTKTVTKTLGDVVQAVASMNRVFTPAVTIPDVVPRAIVAILTYPKAILAYFVSPRSDISRVLEASATTNVLSYPSASITNATPIADIHQVEPTTILPAVIEVSTYPSATLEVSESDPTATIEVKV